MLTTTILKPVPVIAFWLASFYGMALAMKRKELGTKEIFQRLRQMWAMQSLGSKYITILIIIHVILWKVLRF